MREPRGVEPWWRRSLSPFRVGIKKRCSPEVVDLAMSAVLASAMGGDSAARHFLAHMLEKRGAVILADSWVRATR